MHDLSFHAAIFSFCVQRRLADTAPEFGAHGEREARGLQGQCGSAYGQGVRGRNPYEAESFFAFVQPEELGICPKTCLLQNEKNARRLAAMASMTPWIRQYQRKRS